MQGGWTQVGAWGLAHGKTQIGSSCNYFKELRRTWEVTSKQYKATDHPFIHWFVQQTFIGTAYVPGPAHSFHKDLMSTCYMAGVVNRADLISALPELGVPGNPVWWSGQTRAWHANHLVGSGNWACARLAELKGTASAQALTLALLPPGPAPLSPFSQGMGSTGPSHHSPPTPVLVTSSPATAPVLPPAFFRFHTAAYVLC